MASVSLDMHRSKVDFPEPDFTTCGGVTPFMKIAKLAESNNLPIISHGAHDIHIQLLGACSNAAFDKRFFIFFSTTRKSATSGVVRKAQESCILYS